MRQDGLATVLSLTWEYPYLGKTVFILKRVPDDLLQGCVDKMSEAVEHELQQLLAAHTQEEAQLHSLRLLSQYIQQSSTGEELPDLEESKEEEEEDNGMWATPFNNGEKNGQVKYLINHIENGSHLSNGNGHADLPFSLLHHKHLPQFMWYVLNQCFGWKESGETRTQKDGRIHKEVAVKPQLISILDDFIKWWELC